MPASERPNGLQHAAQEQVDGDQAGQREEIEHALVFQIEQHRIGAEVQEDAVRTAQGLVVEKHIEHHLRKSHGDHDEVDAVRAHHQKTDDQCSQGGSAHRQRQAGVQADGLVGRGGKSQCIACNAEVGCMAQGHEACDTLE